MSEDIKERSYGPVMIAAGVAAVGLLSLVLVDHGPWNKPQVQTMIQHGTTAAAAHAAGAKEIGFLHLDLSA